LYPSSLPPTVPEGRDGILYNGKVFSLDGEFGVY